MGTTCSNVLGSNRIQDTLDVVAKDPEVSDIHHNEQISVPDITTHSKKSQSWSWFSTTKRSIMIKKTASLQSSFHGRHSVVESEVQHLKREHEMYVLQKEKEIAHLLTEKSQLQGEVTRLRGELKVLNARMPKLRIEKDKALSAEKDALERAQAFEQEKEKIQRQFKLFREHKEKELQTLLKEKQMLFARLRKYIGSDISVHDYNGDGGDLMRNSVNEWLSGADIHSLDETSIGHEQARASGYGVQLGPFAPVLKQRKGDVISVLQSMLGSLLVEAERVPSGAVLRAYITATPDLMNLVSQLQENCEDIKWQCELDNCLLLLMDAVKSKEIPGKDQIPVCTDMVKQCQVFIVFVGSQHSRNVAMEMEEAMLQKKLMIVAVLAGSENEETVQNWISTYPHNRLCQLRKLPEQSQMVPDTVVVLQSICNKLVQLRREAQRDVSTTVDSNIPKSLDIDWLQQVCLEQEERLLIHANYGEDLFEVEKYLQCLNDHLLQEGPLQPLLVTGASGSGKSTILARWIEEIQQSLSDCMVVYHFACYGVPVSAASVDVTWRFSQQISGARSPSCNPKKLGKGFPRLLERCAAMHKDGVVIVIDCVDMLLDSYDMLDWLLDPLPVRTRVVVSVNTSTTDVPSKWLNWPTLNIVGLSKEASAELLERKLQHPTLLPQCKSILAQWFAASSHTSATVDIFSNPSFLHLCTKLLMRCNSPESLYGTFEKCSGCSTLSELYELVLQKLCEDFTAPAIEDVLLLLCALQDGLSEAEVVALSSGLTWPTWTRMKHELVELKVVLEITGLLYVVSFEVHSAVVKFFDVSDNSERMTTLRNRFVQCCSSKLRGGFVPHRAAVQLPWHLTKMDQKAKLKDWVRKMPVFVQFVLSGQCRTLTNYWHYAGVSLNDVAEIYMDECKALEKLSELARIVPFMYDLLGQFLCGTGQLKLAVQPLETALELRETTLDPDDPSIGESFHHLGTLYTQWKKFSTAEEYYKQALEIKETVFGSSHMSLVVELESLSALHVMMERSTTSEQFQKRAALIRQKATSEWRKERVQELMVKCHTYLDVLQQEHAVNRGVCKVLNDLGMLHLAQEQFSDAERLLQAAVDAREKILGRDHPEHTESLANLATLYEKMKMFDLAEEAYKQVLQIHLTNLPADDPVVQVALRNLALLYAEQGKYDAAEELYRKLVEILEQTKGPNDPGVGSACNNLAVLLSKMEQLDEALPIYERAVQIYEDSFGVQDQKVSEVLKNIAKLHYDKRESKEAAEVYRMSMDASGRGPYRSLKLGSISKRTSYNQSSLTAYLKNPVPLV